MWRTRSFFSIRNIGGWFIIFDCACNKGINGSLCIAFILAIVLVSFRSDVIEADVDEVFYSNWNGNSAVPLRIFNLFTYTVSISFLWLILHVNNSGFVEVGGYGSLVAKYTALGSEGDWSNSTCGRPNRKAFTMLRGPTDPDYPWPGFLFGQSPASIWYWAADQVQL